MSKVAIVTDSTAYLPAELTRGLAITTVPLQVIWGEETYRDGIDITPEQFYKRLPESKINPTTSQPSPAAFRAIYENLLDQGYDILSIVLSSRLSGTMDSAIQARTTFPAARIEIVDALTTSMAMGFPVLEAARAAANGATLAEAKTIAEKSLKNTRIFFVLNTLEYLRRGGRIGGAQAFLGAALNLKPILEVREGRVEALERVRTFNKAQDRLVEIVKENVGSRKPISLAILHSIAETEAKSLLERTCSLFPVSDVRETAIVPVSPVVGVHVGPGCLGVAFMAGM